MATNTRPYSIFDADGGLVGIVIAHNSAAALRHFARDTFRVEVAHFTDGMEAAARGIIPQRATAEQPE